MRSRTRHRRRADQPEGASWLSLQDILANGLAAVTVLTFVAAVFSGPGKEFIGRRTAQLFEGDIALNGLAPEQANATPHTLVRLQQVLLVVSTPDESAPVVFSLDGAQRTHLHSLRGVFGSRRITLLRFDITHGARWRVLVTNPTSSTLNFTAAVRAYIGDRQVPEEHEQLSIAASQGHVLWDLCRSPLGDLRVVKLNSTSVC